MMDGIRRIRPKQAIRSASVIRVTKQGASSCFQIPITRCQLAGSFTLGDSPPMAARILAALVQISNRVISPMKVETATKDTNTNIATSFAFFLPRIHVRFKCVSFLMPRISQLLRRRQRSCSGLASAASGEHNPTLSFQRIPCVVSTVGLLLLN